MRTSYESNAIAISDAQAPQEFVTRESSRRDILRNPSLIREAIVLLFGPRDKWLAIEEKKMAQAVVVCRFTYINYLYKHETRPDYRTSKHENWTHEHVTYVKEKVCNPS
jgi:hypothetical protein